MAVFSRLLEGGRGGWLGRCPCGTALALDINQVLDEIVAEQEGEFDADTRWAIAWFYEVGVGFDMGEYWTRTRLL